jgi:hypothetical protein
MAKTVESVKMKALINLSFFRGEETLLGNTFYQNEDKVIYSNIAMEGEYFTAPESRVAELISNGYAEIAK